MRVAIGIGGAGSGRNLDFEPVVSFAVEAERLGVDVAWSAEAWGQDAVSPLAFVAARTTKLLLGTGIMQISARAPAMTAMTALALAGISKGRFLLGTIVFHKGSGAGTFTIIPTNVRIADSQGGIDILPVINPATLRNPPIPEPGTIGLLALGLGGLALATRRRNY